MTMAAHSLAELALGERHERELISTICDWERMAYGEGKHRVPDAFHACAKKNRTGFFILRSESGLVGYADVWELPYDFYSDLRIGTVSEESIAEQFVLSRSDNRSRLWYIGSIITNPRIRRDRPISGALAFAAICNVLPSFFQQHTDFPAKVLGVGSSDFGKKLLTRWGFSPVERDRRAIDLRPRFEKTMTNHRDADDLHIGRRRRD